MIFGGVHVMPYSALGARRADPVDPMPTQWRGDDLAQAESLYDHAFAMHRQTELYQGGVHDLAILTLRWEQGRLAEAAELGMSRLGIEWGKP